MIHGRKVTRPFNIATFRALLWEVQPDEKPEKTSAVGNSAYVSHPFRSWFDATSPPV